MKDEFVHLSVDSTTVIAAMESHAKAMSRIIAERAVDGVPNDLSQVEKLSTHMDEIRWLNGLLGGAQYYVRVSNYVRMAARS